MLFCVQTEELLWLLVLLPKCLCVFSFFFQIDYVFEWSTMISNDSQWFLVIHSNNNQYKVCKCVVFIRFEHFYIFLFHGVFYHVWDVNIICFENNARTAIKISTTVHLFSLCSTDVPLICRWRDWLWFA